MPDSPKAAFKRLPRQNLGTSPRGENPKFFFFKVLKNDPKRFFRLFASTLESAGFQPVWVRKRAHHNVWNVCLRRDRILPGTEAETAADVVSTAIRRSGAECLEREVEVSVIGDRVGLSFIFEQGVPGTLVFRQGKECWCDDPMP